LSEVGECITDLTTKKTVLACTCYFLRPLFFVVSKRSPAWSSCAHILLYTCHLDSFRPLIDNTESGLQTHGFLAHIRGPRTSLAADTRADLYLAHASSREKYNVKKEIMPDSVRGMGRCMWRTARLAGVTFLRNASQLPTHGGSQPPAPSKGVWRAL